MLFPSGHPQRRPGEYALILYRKSFTTILNQPPVKADHILIGFNAQAFVGPVDAGQVCPLYSHRGKAKGLGGQLPVMPAVGKRYEQSRRHHGVGIDFLSGTLNDFKPESPGPGYR